MCVCVIDSWSSRSEHLDSGVDLRLPFTWSSSKPPNSPPTYKAQLQDHDSVVPFNAMQARQLHLMRHFTISSEQSEPHSQNQKQKLQKVQNKGEHRLSILQMTELARGWGYGYRRVMVIIASDFRILQGCCCSLLLFCESMQFCCLFCAFLCFRCVMFETNLRLQAIVALEGFLCGIMPFCCSLLRPWAPGCPGLIESDSGKADPARNYCSWSARKKLIKSHTRRGRIATENDLIWSWGQMYRFIFLALQTPYNYARHDFRAVRGGRGD